MKKPDFCAHCIGEGKILFRSKLPNGRKVYMCKECKSHKFWLDIAVTHDDECSSIYENTVSAMINITRIRKPSLS